MRKHSPHHDLGLVVAWTPSKADEQPDCETGNLLVVIHEEAKKGSGGAEVWWALPKLTRVPSPKMFAQVSTNWIFTCANGMNFGKLTHCSGCAEVSGKAVPTSEDFANIQVPQFGLEFGFSPN